MDIDAIKRQVDLHDLAAKLGLQRPGGSGNYKSPHHNDKVPSLSIYESKADGQRWKDWSNDGEGGTCIDMVMYVLGLEFNAAIDWLRDQYGFAKNFVANHGDVIKTKPTLAEFIADNALKNAARVKDYLISRGIYDDVIEKAIKTKSIGFNDYISGKKNPGELGYGGPAAAFIVRSMNPGHVVAVDLRYLDPALNGNVKTQCQGEKVGYPWFMDLQALKRASTVYIVESPINALSIEGCGLKNTTAVAVRGINVEAIDWLFLAGKKVIICMDNDQPDEKGNMPGKEAAWKLSELLVGMNIACHLIDQSDWIHHSWNDVNDIAMAEMTHPTGTLKQRLQKLEEWVIPGMSGKQSQGKRRLFLPEHDFSKYWTFRTREDFTQLIKEVQDEDGNVEEKRTDLCGFRVAAITRVSIAGATSVMSGEVETSPKTLFAISVQTPRHGNKLTRRVVPDERLHNIDLWGKFGPVFNRQSFLRMINILERGAHLGARDAANFVGLCWRGGQLIVNEGPDTYFTEPEKQCPYSDLTFPSGPVGDAKTVIVAYQKTFTHNAALIALTWALGGHLKVLLGFWPHMTMQANKGAGKSTLIKRLERSIAFTMFSGQSLQTEFRLLTSVSHTSHPVGWEELSARRQEVIDKAVAMLQESYQFTITRRGSELTEYVMCAPVMLAGEDVPVRSLIGKVVRTDLTGKKGAVLPQSLPRFPVKQWLKFLSTQKKDDILNSFDRANDYCREHCRAPGDDDGANRMVGNYAALLTAWKLLAEFAGIDPRDGGFVNDLIMEMNSHIAETDADREPWVWIVEMALSEIDRRHYLHPFKYEVIDNNGLGDLCLLIRPGHIIDHIAHTPALKDRWNALPIKSAMIFNRQLENSGLVIKKNLERVISNKRITNLTAISVEKMATYGLFASPDQYAEADYDA